jgi:hypothetical protein
MNKKRLKKSIDLGYLSIVYAKFLSLTHKNVLEYINTFFIKNFLAKNYTLNLVLNPL